VILTRDNVALVKSDQYSSSVKAFSLDEIALYSSVREGPNIVTVYKTPINRRIRILAEPLKKQYIHRKPQDAKQGIKTVMDSIPTIPVFDSLKTVDRMLPG
jgi:hypothetical protein